MKADNPIRINRARDRDPDGGGWASLDPVAQGRVQVISAGDSHISQAQAVIAELRRLAALDPDWDWSECAVLARRWAHLDPVRSLCDLEGIPVRVGNEEGSIVWHLRETQRLVRWLRGRDSQFVSGAELDRWLSGQPESPNSELLAEVASEYAREFGGAESSTDQCVEFLAEWARSVRARGRGLLLTTAHRAKGLEFDHVAVMDGGWNSVGEREDPDAARRLYYVAMTRARRTLALARLPGRNPMMGALTDHPSVLHRDVGGSLPPPAPELSRCHRSLGLKDVFLGFAGYRNADDPVHGAIAALAPGDRLRVSTGSDRWSLLDGNGVVVGQTAASYAAPSGMRCVSAKVLAIAEWDRKRSDPQYQQHLRCERWEVVIPELVFEPDG